MRLKNASVILSRDTDSTTWDAMKRVVSSCREAGVPIPDDVIDFFGGDVDTTALSCNLPAGALVVSYGDDNQTSQVFTINLTKLPPGSRLLRIVMEE